MSDATASPPPSPPPEEALEAWDPIEAMRARGKVPELAALLAWLVPGAGHLYAGHRVKGLASLVLILGMYVAGLWVSRCEAVSLEGDMGHQYAFIAQVGAGGPTALALAYSHGKLPWRPERGEGEYWSEPAYVERLPAIDVGLLLTMVAGLLNLLLIHDALNGIPGALHRRLDEARHRRRLEALRVELEGQRPAPPAATPPGATPPEAPPAAPGAGEVAK